MPNSIPASQLVQVLPGVLGAGGNPLSLNAVFLSADTSVPIGTVEPFATAADVSAWFGPTAPEAILADIYFNGFTGANTLPGTLYFAQFNGANVHAYLRSASQADITLAVLQSYSGQITITIDGRTQTSDAINLSTATSFSNAATIIQTGVQNPTGRFSGTGSQALGVLTIATTGSGHLAVGDTVTGAGVFGGSATVNSFGTYTVLAGTGTVNVSTSGTTSTDVVDVAGVGVVSYDALRAGFVITSPTTGTASTISYGSGTLSVLLDLRQSDGAVTSQGANAATPASVMDSVVAATQNWATFMTVTEQILSVKQGFAAWVNAQNQRYAYICQDSDATALAPNATGSFGVLTNTDTGVCPVWDNSGGSLAAFICGTAASIDFEERAGRITFAFKGQSGLAAQITDASVAANLTSNGYNFYAAYATAAQGFTMLQTGLVSGVWKWLDAYINQIALNASLQLALMELLTNVKSVPYNTTGYNLIRSACQDPINAAVNFGSIQPGVALSASQASAVNSAAGIKIDSTLSTVGWYLQVTPASSITRGTRGSPPITLWYTDGGSVQKISLASIDIM